MKPDQLTINRQLRRGGFGRYYECTDENGVEWYSITCLKPREDREDVVRFLRGLFDSARGN